MRLKRLIIPAALTLASLTAAAAPHEAAQADTAGYTRFRFGGYGEMLAQFKDYGINRLNGTPQGNERRHRNSISIPRFVLAFDYKFSKRWILGAEIEFEAGGTGSAYEIENSENGEYETEVEKGGEVALEQLHITYLGLPAINFRAGHLIVPFGLVNAHHEPINFFGSERPQSETAFLPSTWHETGIEIFGSFGSRKAVFDYQAMVIAGLNANGFERDSWIAAGKQGFFETDNFTSPGYVARLDWRGVKGLRTGISGYYCRDAGSNSDKPHTYSDFHVPVALFGWDAQYRCKWLTARANLVYGYMGNSKALSAANKLLSNNSPYSRLTPIPKNALGYGAEAGLKISSLMRVKFPDIVPFARYDYYNPQRRGSRGQTMDARFEVSQWEVGLNWFPLPNLVVKADYVTRQIGTSRVFGKGRYNSENEFEIGIAYIGWFIKK